MGRKRAWTAVQRPLGLSQTRGQTVSFIREDLSLADGLKSIFFISSLIRRRAGVRARSAGAGLAMAEGVFAREADRHQERHL